MTDATAPRRHDLNNPARLSWRILEAVSYLEQCRKSARSFAIVTASSPSEVHLAINQFIAAVSTPMRVARVVAPTDSGHVFLEAILAQLGFESFAATADDLLRLLTVVMRHGSDRQDPICVVVEDAQNFGPRVFETMRELARNTHDEPWAPLFVLGGDPALLRVLDSRGMSTVAELTRHRFDLSATSGASFPGSPGSAAPGTEGPELVLSLNDDTLQRFPVDGMHLLIGRGPHCDICIRSRFVSRQHALFIRSADGDWLVDLKSTNGTSVNSQLVTQRRLIHGDVVSLGNHRLQYLNPVGRWIERSGAPSPDQFSATMIMRSLQPVLDTSETALTAATGESNAA